jgi:hypothetical protein
VIEKVTTLLVTHSLDELEKEEKKYHVMHIDVLSKYMSALALGSIYKPYHWKCPIKNESEVGDCSFTDVQANEVEKAIIDKAFLAKEFLP